MRQSHGAGDGAGMIETYPMCTEKEMPFGDGKQNCIYKIISGQCSYDGVCYAQNPKTQATLDAERILTKITGEINQAFKSHRPGAP